MNTYQQLDELNIDGYLFTSDVVNAGISRTTLVKYVKDRKYERAAYGVYISPETWPDELYILNRSYPGIIFSGETALYLHLLMDREYNDIIVSVPSNFSGQRLRNKGIVVHRERDGIYGLGKSKIETNYGHTVNVYNRERCICDMVKRRKDYEVQTYQTVLKEYMRSKEKDLTRLLEYASVFNLRDEIMKYVEVMI